VRAGWRVEQGVRGGLGFEVAYIYGGEGVGNIHVEH